MNRTEKESLHSPGTPGRTDDLLIRLDAPILRPHQAFKGLKRAHREWVPGFCSRHIYEMPGVFKDVLNFVEVLASSFPGNVQDSNESHVVWCDLKLT